MPRREIDQLPGRPPVHRAFTDVSDGDLCVDLPPEELAPRRARVAPYPWTWLHQVHGGDVVVVAEPGGGAGRDADAAVTDVPGAVLAVHTADCAGVLLWGPGRGDRVVVGAAHAGWRGLDQGVLQHAVQAMRDLGAQDVRWELGPCISPAAYEFGLDDLDRLADRLGPGVRARTLDGAPSLDLRAGVAAALAEVGARAVSDDPVACTALDGGFHSWRARGDRGRQAAVIWVDPPGPARGSR